MCSRCYLNIPALYLVHFHTWIPTHLHTLALQVIGEEMLVSGSDDFTMFLWKPSSEKQSLARWVQEIRLDIVIY